MITFYYDNKFFVYLLYAYYAIFNVRFSLQSLAHWKENNISICLFKFLMVKSVSYFGLNIYVARTLFELRSDNSYKQQVPVDFQNLLQ